MPARAWKDIASRTYTRTWDDNVGLVAAGVAFYGFFALLSLIGVIVLFYGWVAEPRTVLGHVQALTAILPSDIAALIGDQLMNAVQSPGRTKGIGILLALGVALYGGTNGAAAILTALNIAYEEKEKRSLLRFYLLAAAMAVAAIGLALLAIAAAAAVAFLKTRLPDTQALAVAGEVAGYAALVLVASGIAATLYRFGPSREEARWRWITPGSLFAAITWLLLTVLFTLYVSNLTDYSATYGSLGAVVALLTWLYLSAYAFMFGAELNSEIEHQTAKDSTTGPEQPMGKRGAWAADNVAEDDEVQDRPEEAREGELTRSAPQVAEQDQG
ncbi:MAG TPA: YihY/virulence factor BrkB family protein [Sphingomicrobium sp.]|nr:YihY/virulence factor BrkB family protein [Sphingomicrobium sp.]